MEREPLVAGVELGGTKLIAVLARGQDILRELVIPTTVPEATLGKASEQLARWHREDPFVALGIASFGPLQLDRDRPDFGHMLATPKPGWSGADILGALGSGFSCPVAIDTDVNGAAIAELQWGAGADDPLGSLCYITIGTGVGGGFVVDGKPLHGAMHPELGHIRVPRAAGDAFPGTCPFHRDCIEGLVSGPALEARFGMPGAHIPDDDPRWRHVASDLAQLVSTILLMTSVPVVLIGGGVGTARPQLLDLVRAEALKLLGGYLPYVDAEHIARIVRRPQLGNRAGPLGAIALALRELLRPAR